MTLYGLTTMKVKNVSDVTMAMCCNQPQLIFFSTSPDTMESTGQAAATHHFSEFCSAELVTSKKADSVTGVGRLNGRDLFSIVAVCSEVLPPVCLLSFTHTVNTL